MKEGSLVRIENFKYEKFSTLPKLNFLKNHSQLLKKVKKVCDAEKQSKWKAVSVENCSEDPNELPINVWR